jgi:predicted Zn-dependent peptidase
MFPVEKKVLNNGLRVVLAPMENSEAITIQVLVGVGSRYEPKKINGISHFLEHMFFKGTKSRPKPGQVHKDLNKIGAAYNAFTSKENTGFWVKSSAKDFDVGLNVVSDILLEPLFKNEEIEKERNVIIQEINMIEDDPPRKIISDLENVLYGNQPVGWDISGKKETVRSIKRTDIIKYKSDNYLSENMIVVVAGNFDKNTTFKKIQKSFKRIKKGRNKPAEKVKVFQKSPQIKIIKKQSDQTHFALALKGYDMFDEKRYALNILAAILGGNMSSMLFTEIREKLGLAYYVYAYGDQYTDCGYLGMAAGIPHDKFKKVIRIIIKIIKNIKEKGISKKDLDFAKSFIRGQMALSFETSDQIASFVSNQELFYKKILQPEEILKKLEKVSQNDILRVTRDIFRPDKINMAVIGQQEGREQKIWKKILQSI